MMSSNGVFMRATDIQRVRSSLHFSTRTYTRPRKRLVQKSATLKIAHGAYLDRSLLDECSTQWQRRAYVMLARILTVHHHFKGRVVFSHDSALRILHISTRQFSPDVTCRIDGGYGEHMVFPQVLYDGDEVLPAGRMLITRCQQVAEPISVEGLRLSAASQMLFESKRVDGFDSLVRMSSILSTLAQRFEPFRDGREEFARDLREQALTAISACSWKRQPRKALTLIEKASGMCESIAECSLYAILEEILPPAHFEDLRQQVEVELKGKRYFLDFFLGKKRLVLEVEGVEKNGLKNVSLQQAHQAFCDRVLDIESQGWKVYPLSASDCLYRPSQVKEKLATLLPYLPKP